MLVPMLLIAAALEEELKTGISLCEQNTKIPNRHLSFWQANYKDTTIGFLKTGVGPRRSAQSLEEALKTVYPSRVLVIGYAGALDPAIKLGDLVAVDRALAFSLDKSNPSWEHIQLDATYKLADCEALVHMAKESGLNARVGDIMTSSYVLGDPAHKNLLYGKFHASIVDMETAALARVAASGGVPISCVRVISDEASDTFLAPFSYDPSTPIPARAKKLIGTGMVQTYRQWKSHTAVARGNLVRFLSCYLERIQNSRK